MHLELVGKSIGKMVKKYGKWKKGKRSGKCHHCDKPRH